MKDPQRAEPRDLALAGGVAATCALVFGVMLASLASSGDFNTRLTDLMSSTEQAAGLMRITRAMTSVEKTGSRAGGSSKANSARSRSSALFWSAKFLSACVITTHS